MRILIAFTLSLLMTTAQASDLQREARIAAQIEDAILEGEPIRLKAGEVEYFAIHTETDAATPRGTAILLHGRGANPDWHEVIQPLRVGLPRHGWNTLSIQLPVADAEAPAEDWLALIPKAAPRIEAAVTHLRELGQSNIVLVAHSMGSRMAAVYLAGDTPAPEVRAFVAVGMNASSSDTVGDLRRIRLPVYDLYGERDLPEVKQTVTDRRIAAGVAGNKAYTQEQVPGADHFFNGMDTLLLERVSAWLAKTMP